jgi:hypothetical protein
VKVAGITIIRNALKFDYPVTESIRSILPLVDKMYVGVGNSQDDTRGLIESIASEKLVIIDSVWDERLREGGKVLAVETNKVLDAVPADFDWIFYIQADEILHEEGIPFIREALSQHLRDSRVEGLLLKYRHFYGHYRYFGDSRRWYTREVRVVRNLKSVRSFRDAQGFRIDNRLMRVKLVDAYIHHYGWVKNPVFQLAKDKEFQKLWHSDERLAKRKVEATEYDYKNIDSLSLYQGTHPAVMKERIQAADWDFVFDTEVKNFSFKDSILNFIERITGYRLFKYKNYKII